MSSTLPGYATVPWAESTSLWRSKYRPLLSLFRVSLRCRRELVGLVLGGAQALSRGALGRPFGFAPAIAVGTVAILFLPRMWLLHLL